MSPVGKIASLFVGFILSLAVFFIPYIQQVSSVQREVAVYINDQIIVAESVSDEKKIEKGLAGRFTLGINEGMLFVFAEKGFYPIWMKGMNFPIDIIWISGNEVVGFEENVQPEPDKDDPSLTVYHPPRLIDKVLEVSSGRAKLLRLSVGDAIELRPLVPRAYKN